MSVYDVLSRVTKHVDTDVENDARVVLRDLWCLHGTLTRMPCTNPCSLLRNDFATLRTQPYAVGAKTDGVRFYLLLSYMCLAGGKEREYALLIDRAFRMVEVELSAPPALFEGTLIDGELVVDGDSLLFVLFDLVASAGFAFRMQVHSKRMDELAKVAQQLRVDVLRLQLKQWLPFTPPSVRQLLVPSASAAAERALPADGLIFVAERKQLVPGMQRDMFKWKPAEQNTIDFLREGGGLFLAGERGLEDAQHAVNVRPIDPWPAELNQDGVVECECTARCGVWQARPLKMRLDKHTPNSVRVAILTLQNIDENITVHDLMDLAAELAAPARANFDA